MSNFTFFSSFIHHSKLGSQSWPCLIICCKLAWVCDRPYFSPTIAKGDKQQFHWNYLPSKPISTGKKLWMYIQHSADQPVEGQRYGEPPSQCGWKDETGAAFFEGFHHPFCKCRSTQDLFETRFLVVKHTACCSRAKGRLNVAEVPDRWGEGFGPVKNVYQFCSCSVEYKIVHKYVDINVTGKLNIYISFYLKFIT